MEKKCCLLLCNVFLQDTHAHYVAKNKWTPEQYSLIICYNSLSKTFGVWLQGFAPISHKSVIEVGHWCLLIGPGYHSWAVGWGSGQVTETRPNWGDDFLTFVCKGNCRAKTGQHKGRPQSVPPGLRSPSRGPKINQRVYIMINGIGKKFCHKMTIFVLFLCAL